ncbi:MAG: PKD domain-containing protein, partial [Nitriliruptoraceae bacterium]|nr:PKD domain-containing protein [Nitriliruptoraceae bacterium]
MGPSIAAPGHDGRSLVRRLIAATLAVVLITSGLVLNAAQPAHAGLYNVFPADADGFPKGRFFADEGLFATFTTDLDGGRICVVALETTDPGATNCDSATVWGNPRFFVGIGTLLGMPLIGTANLPLPTGQWRLMADARVQVDGRDEWVGTELSEVFEVVPCRGVCDFAPAQAQIQAWKDTAEAKMGGFKAVCTVKDLLDIKDTVDKIQDARDAAKVARGMYALAGGGLGAMLVGASAGAVAFFADTPSSTEDMAMSLFKELSCGVSAMYQGIYEDPPDFDYDEVAPPALWDLPTTGDAFLDELAETWMRMQAYGDASRIAYERFQGAVIDGDDAAAALQAQATADFTFQLVADMRRSQRLQPEFAALDWLDVPISTPQFHAEAIALRQRIHAEGHTAEERQALLDLGFAESVIDQLEVEYGANAAAFEAIDPSATLADVLAPITAQIPGAIDVYDDFARRMDVTASEYRKLLPIPEPNRAPVSGFTSTPSTGVAPLTVEFASTAFDPDGDELTLRWNIAGIRTVDDETSITHTFETPGTYGVSLVADDGELWDQAVQWITVMPPDVGPDPANQPPVALFTPQFVDEVGPVTQTFTSTSFDPDGDELTHTWYFGDGQVLTGPVVTRTFEPGFIMSVLLVVADEGGLTGQAAGEVTSRHAAGDPDPNSPPVASFDATPTTGTAPLEVQFTSTSTDPDGDELTHTWNFGDGQTAEGESVSHVYATPGTYLATLVVDDGRASRLASQQIVVTGAPGVLEAAFTTSNGYDAAKLVNGSRIVSVSSQQNDTTSAAGNAVGPTTASWFTPVGADTDQDIVLRLPADGRDLLDRIQLTGVANNQSPRTISVELSTSPSPAGPWRTVVDRAEMARVNGPQEFTFDTQTARFVRVTLHDNHGASNFRLQEISLPSVDREGGIVSLPYGPTARIIEASSVSTVASLQAENVLLPDNSAWASASGQTTDQFLRVELGGVGTHLIDTVRLRGSTSTWSVRSFEVLVSEDGTTWTSAVSGELPRNAELHDFTFAPRPARFLELRAADNHGSPSSMRLSELQAVTTAGLQVADGDSGVGAGITSASAHSGGNLPENAIGVSPTSRWQSLSGATTDQHLRVLLRNGEVHTIDRVMVAATANRPRNVEVWVSDTGQEPGDFSKVAERTLFNVGGPQWLQLDPVDARYVELRILDGYGSTHVLVAELQVYTPERGGGAQVPFADTSAPGDHDIVAWEWDFGHAGGTSSDRHPVHTFPGPGIYEVALTVTDAVGATHTAAGSFTVPGDPSLDIVAAATTVNEGQNVPLRAEGAGIALWSWDLDYTQPSTTNATVNARFPDQGEYDVTIRGFTGDGVWTAPVTLTFTVLNVPPTVNTGRAVTVYAGEPLTPPNSTATDPGDDVLTCTWAWGDGTTTVVEDCTSLRSRVPHVYALPGEYEATLTVDDGDGGVTSDTVTYAVLPRPSLLQVREVLPGDDLDVTVRLVDGRSGHPLPDEDVTVTVPGAAPDSGVTDATGERSVRFVGSGGVESVAVAFAGNALYLPAALDRPVAVPAADIVFIADRSNSMGNKHEAVIDRLSEIGRGLGSHLDYRLGLVGYAHWATDRGAGHVMSPLTREMDDFLPALQQLLDVSSASANAYNGIVRAAQDDLGFRPNAASCFVLVSDATVGEIPASGMPDTQEEALAALNARDTTLFSIVWAQQATIDAYGAPDGIAGQTGGQSWTITEFMADASAVLDALVDGCVTAAVTPDIAVAKTSSSDLVTPGETVTYELTVSNEAAVDVTGVELVDALPDDVAFLSASDGGVLDEATRQVTWPTFSLAAGASVERTIVVRMPTSGFEPGDHALVNRATVNDDGARGPERRMDNNTDEHTVTVRVVEESEEPEEPEQPGEPGVADVGVVARHDQPGGVEAGQAVDHTIVVTNHGTEVATGVRLLEQVPDRFEVTAIDAPGWDNPAGVALVGAHPDGVTTGSWLHLERDELAIDAEVTVVVTLQVRPITQPDVVEDEGSLDALPPVVAAPPSTASTQVCVEVDRDDVADNDCAELDVPLRDLFAQVTVRMWGGAPFLIVSVATTDAVGEGPVTLRWTPMRDGAPLEAVPAEIVIEDLEPGPPPGGAGAGGGARGGPFLGLGGVVYAVGGGGGGAGGGARPRAELD